MQIHELDVRQVTVENGKMKAGVELNKNNRWFEVVFYEDEIEARTGPTIKHLVNDEELEEVRSQVQDLIGQSDFLLENSASEAEVEKVE